jgi:outer membrane protein OmpA-like peptidoglycan-associated protein
VLRIWIGTPVLFERDAAGRERISDAGKVRLDSAMSQFLKYPKNSPLVVEGYARPPATRDERFLLSRTRAGLVRDYIIEKFGLDPNYIGIMPMGSEAVDSPAGSEWDGVALAMFVSTAAL